MSLLPSRPDTSAADEVAPSVVGVDSDRADALMAALSSGTARELLTALHEEPGPPSALAERVGTSLQNAQYHLERLEDAGAVEVVDTAYSEKGREMDIYAPADRPLVIFAGREEQSRSLRAAVRELITGVGALALASVAVQELFGRSVTRLFGGPGGAGGADAGPSGDAGGGAAGPATDTPTAAPGTDTVSGGGVSPTPGATAEGTATGADLPSQTATPMETATATTAEATRTATESADAVAQLPPGVLFFLGGLLALLVVVALVR